MTCLLVLAIGASTANTQALAASARPEPGVAVAPGLPSLPWPARLALEPGLKPETLAVKGAAWRPMGTIEPVDGPIVPIHLGSFPGKTVKKTQEEDWKLVVARLDTPIHGAKPQYEQSGGFVFVPSPEDEPPAAASGPVMFRFVSARAAGNPDPAGAQAVIVERTWFALYDPLPPRTPKGEPPATDVPRPRGLIVFLPGMFGTPTDQIVALIKRMRQEGYSVLRMMSQPSRFTESVTYPLEMEGDIAGAVQPIAADLTDRASEAAYAVEAATLYAGQLRPALCSLPRLAVGMSGGAMLLPIVLAREPGAYAGAVSIAGGVDYLRILVTSNYINMIDAVRVRWTTATPVKAPADGSPPPIPTPSPKRLDELGAIYRAAAPLDSSNLVGMLKSIPWLIIHGSSDKAVPASTGEELWEKLGKPERIVIKGGHEWVFFTLSGRFDAIAEWLNKRATNPAPVSAPAGQAATEKRR